MSSQFRVAPTAGGDASVAQRRTDSLDDACDDQSTSDGIESLYRRHHARLMRFFSRRTHPPDAQDLVHETFARYADGAAGHVERPDAYLSQVAANLLRDRAKFAVRRAAAYHQVFDDEQVSGNDPVARLEARDLLRRLDAAVQRLKPRRREVFLLQRVDGLTYAQIAESTGMSVKAVKKQMAKALLDLRRDFGPF